MIDYQTEIDVLMSEAAQSISASLRHCFPGRVRLNADVQNGLREAIIVTHFALACGKRDFAIYPEAANHDEERNHTSLDLMVFDWRRNWRIDMEAKRLYNFEGARQIFEDLERISRFQPNPVVNVGYPILAPALRTGVVAAITEDQVIADWWANWSDPKNRQPTNHDWWQRLKDHPFLRHWREVIPVKSWTDRRPQYLLYAVFNLNA